MRFISIIGFLLVNVSCSHNGAAKKPPRQHLWNVSAPIGDGRVEGKDVWITLYRPPETNGAAVVICPGGGYRTLAVDPEGHGIAQWLKGVGVTGIVLEYRLPAGRPRVPLLDAQRAIRTVRRNATDWGVDPERVGILGFSAGGHLASTAGTHFDDGDPNALDPVERFSCRPDFQVLIYPVITMGAHTHQGSRSHLLGENPAPDLIERFSSEKQVTGRTPPAFIAHAIDDEPVPPENSRMFHAALQANGIRSRYLELPSGGHGLNGYSGPMWDAWQEQSLAWLAELEVIPTGVGERE